MPSKRFSDDRGYGTSSFSARRVTRRAHVPFDCDRTVSSGSTSTRHALGLPFRVAVNVTAGTRVALESHSGHRFVVQVRKTHGAEMLRPMEVAECVRKRYGERRRRFDRYLVSDRVRCGSGFVVVGYRKARRLEREATAALTCCEAMN